eukprot:TRINITY_DN13088_c0_g1_i1.p1 TRINITY_DN13088_c0_g1~~TRINITY_DN13088_c0_g1_i1.p1  ORF type:complete len:296 (+),score=42.58 TRINITY_DN13088_c0_g1_i1:108-890(+)
MDYGRFFLKYFDTFDSFNYDLQGKEFIDIAVGWDHNNGEIIWVVDSVKLIDDVFCNESDHCYQMKSLDKGPFIGFVKAASFKEVPIEFYRYSKRYSDWIIEEVSKADNSGIVLQMGVAFEILNCCDFSSYEALSLTCKEWYRLVKEHFVSRYGSDVLKVSKHINWPKLYFELRKPEENHNNCLRFGLDKYISYFDPDSSFSAYCIMKTVKYGFRNTFENFLKLSGYYGSIVTMEGFISYEREIPLENMIDFLEIFFFLRR